MTRERLAVGLLLLLLLGSRLALLPLAEFAESNYEEATVGLMARHILEGDHVVFWWGQPYLGTSLTYVVALLFAGLPATTLTMRLAPLAYTLTAAATSYGLARGVVGGRHALVALLWWVVPPAYLTRFGLTPYNYISSVAYGCLVLYLARRGAAPPGGNSSLRRGGIWYALGAVCGLAVWDHLISVGVVLAALGWLALLGLRGELPAARRGWAWRVALGFLVGNAPFWLWNVTHRFETITAMVAPAGARQDLWARLRVVRRLLVEVLGRAALFWPDLGGTLHVVPLLVLIYGALLVLALVWAVGQLLPGRPWSPPVAHPAALLLLVGTVGAICAQVALSQYEKGLYLMPIYCAAPVLLAAGARWLGSWGRWGPAALIALLLTLNLTDNAKLVEASLRRHAEPRPVDALIAHLDDAGVRHVYAHYRVAWQLAFESAERITASDFHGYLTDRFMIRGVTASYMRPYFRALAEVDAAPRVALVTHEWLQSPAAAEMVQSLALLGGTYRQERVGLYTVFRDFVPPAQRLEEIAPDELTVRVSHRPDLVAWLRDRNMATVWATGAAQTPGMTLEIELAAPRRVAKLVLDPGRAVTDIPQGLRLEVSEDGTTWRERLGGATFVGGLDWLGRHPKLNVRGKLGLWLDPPATARRLRLTLTRAAHRPWRIAELLVYGEPAGARATDPADLLDDAGLGAVAGLAVAQGVQAVYASDRAALRLRTVLPTAIRTLALLDKRLDPLTWSERVVRFDQPNALLLAAPSARVEAALRRHSVPVELHRVADVVLYVTGPQPAAPALYWDHDQLHRLDPPA